ncbi:MAG: carboxypeptidase-like regulatory domain-containing protein, partial [Tannerella sp.]|nr:carboxypeptidase-like regulatory domain-containing protein [Tannerella sp.]
MNKTVRQIVWYALCLLLVCPVDVGAQEQEQVVTIHLENASLKDIFSAIEKQTTYRFSYRDAVIDNRKDISISRDKASVSSILNDALAGRNLEYSILSARSIVIADKRPATANNVDKLRKFISGTVTDTGGEPVIGANIIEKGATANGTVTDIDGSFSLNVADNAVLQVSYIGYITKEVSVLSAIDGSKSLIIRLIEDAKTLEEVV